MDLFRVLAEFSILIGHLMMWVAYATATPHMDFLLIVASIGLEFFFVMSGFLIGGMLLDITDKGVTLERWGRFTLRRMLRVLPPYLVWLLVLWVLFPPTGGGVKQLLQYLTFTQNLAWPAVSGRWFDVSWSLSVEFWFYLGFGSLSLLAFAFFRRPGFLLVMLAFILLPLIARILYQDMENWDEGMRKVVVFRLDAIAYGVLLVCLLRYNARIMQWRLPLAWFGSLLLLGSVSWWCGVPYAGAESEPVYACRSEFQSGQCQLTGLLAHHSSLYSHCAAYANPFVIADRLWFCRISASSCHFVT